jgi:hypothetical protein
MVVAKVPFYLIDTTFIQYHFNCMVSQYEWLMMTSVMISFTFLASACVHFIFKVKDSVTCSLLLVISVVLMTGKGDVDYCGLRTTMTATYFSHSEFYLCQR